MKRFALLRLSVGLSLLLFLLLQGGCSSTPPAHPSSQQPVPSKLSLEQANDVTLYAISLVGTPYRYGGNTPASGFDCSGLVHHVYRTRGGVVSPRTVTSMKNWGQPVEVTQLRSGDLVIFSQANGVPNHAGIYVGNNRFVHSPSTGGTVRLDHLNSKYWAARRPSFRRP